MATSYGCLELNIGLYQLLLNLGGWGFSFRRTKCKRIKMAVSKMADWGSKWYISVTIRPRKVMFWFYGSIEAMDSAKLSSVIFFTKSKMARYKMVASKMASFCCLTSMQHLQLHSTTILEGVKTYKISDSQLSSHFESIVLVVCGFQTFMKLLL